MSGRTRPPDRGEHTDAGQCPARRGGPHDRSGAHPVHQGGCREGEGHQPRTRSCRIGPMARSWIPTARATRGRTTLGASGGSGTPRTTALPLPGGTLLKGSPRRDLGRASTPARSNRRGKPTGFTASSRRIESPAHSVPAARESRAPHRPRGRRPARRVRRDGAALDRRGELPAIRLPGGAIRYREDAIDGWLAERATPVRGVVEHPAGRRPAASVHSLTSSTPEGEED